MRDENLTFQEKIKKYHLRKLYRIVLCLVMVLVMLAIVHFYRLNKVYSGYETTKTYEAVGSTNSEVSVYNGNQILCYSRDGVSAYNAKGVQLWNQTYEMQSPIIYTAGEYVVAGDYKGNIIYVMNGSGPCAAITCNKIIVDVKVSAGGVVIATLDDSNVTWLELYTSDGANVATIKTSMDQTGFPVNLAMSPDNKKMAVSYLKAKGVGIQTSVAFYNFGDVGQNMTDKIVSGYDYAETVIPHLHFTDDSNAVVVGESTLKVFHGKQIPELKAEAEIEKDVLSIFYGQSYTALVYLNEDEDDKYRLDLYDLNATMVLSRSFNIDYKNILVSNDAVLIYNEADAVMWSIKGVEKYNGNLGVDIKGIIPTNSEMKFLIVRDGSLELVKLK